MKKQFRTHLCVMISLLLLVLLCFAACDGASDGEDTTAEITAGVTLTEETVGDGVTEYETLPETTEGDVTETETVADTYLTTEEESKGDETTMTQTTESVPAETTIPEAGQNSGIVRDGTPKKYFTLSFDDGITQDIRIIEILKKYGMHCATFNINTGLLGANWEWVGKNHNRPDVPHLRFTKEELMTGIYDGFDVEVHTMNHPSLKIYDENVAKLKREIMGDAANIREITGINPVGMAWPGGDTEYTEKTIELVREHTSIRFARATTTTNTFTLPDYFLKWKPTCSITNGKLLDLARQFVEAEADEDMLFFVWGHGYEFDFYDLYDDFEELVKMMSEAEDVVCVTNAEFYQLFKDEIPSWKE